MDDRAKVVGVSIVGTRDNAVVSGDVTQTVDDSGGRRWSSSLGLVTVALSNGMILRDSLLFHEDTILPLLNFTGVLKPSFNVDNQWEIDADEPQIWSIKSLSVRDWRDKVFRHLGIRLTELEPCMAAFTTFFARKKTVDAVALREWASTITISLPISSDTVVGVLRLLEGRRASPDACPDAATLRRALLAETDLDAWYVRAVCDEMTWPRPWAEIYHHVDNYLKNPGPEPTFLDRIAASKLGLKIIAADMLNWFQTYYKTGDITCIIETFDYEAMVVLEHHLKTDPIPLCFRPTRRAILPVLGTIRDLDFGALCRLVARQKLVIDPTALLAVEVYGGILKRDAYGSMDDGAWNKASAARQRAFRRPIPKYTPIGDGHSYSLMADIVTHVGGEVPAGAALAFLEEGQIIHRDTSDDRIYINEIREAEVYVATRIARLAGRPLNLEVPLPRRDHPHLAQLDDTQCAAVMHALRYPVTVISGRGGTGKTRATKTVVDFLGAQHVRLVTYTGQCVSMLSANVTDAFTIHSMIYGVGDVKGNPTIDTLIVDEFSLVSLPLLHQALMAMKAKQLKRLIVVGDEFQLPSMGHGKVLEDMIKGLPPTCTFRFQRNYRNDSATIFHNADQIMLQRASNIKTDGSFRIIEPCPTNDENMIRGLLTELKRDGFSDTDIQFITLTNARCQQINAICRKFFNGVEVTTERRYPSNFYVGEKVCWTRNDYEAKVYNGEVMVIQGYYDVTAASVAQVKGNKGPKVQETWEGRPIKKGWVIVKGTGYIDHHKHKFTRNTHRVVVMCSLYGRWVQVPLWEKPMGGNVVHASCTTIHKMQGNQRAVVIYDIQTPVFQTCRHAYTATTRSTKRMIVIGTRAHINAIIKADMPERRSQLLHRIRQKLALGVTPALASPDGATTLADVIAPPPSPTKLTFAEAGLPPIKDEPRKTPAE